MRELPNPGSPCLPQEPTEAQVEAGAHSMAEENWHWGALPEDDRNSFRRRFKLAMTAALAAQAIAPPAPQAASEPVNWKGAFEMEATKFQAETLRASKLHAMLTRWVQRHQDEHPSGPGTRHCHVCELVAESKALLAAPPAHSATSAPTVMDEKVERFQIALREWAVAQWRAQVEHRPLVNIHRRTLDTVWRQVMRHAGLDPVEAVGPGHDELLEKDHG